MITASIYEIAVLIIALAFLILVIFAIPALIQIKKTARSVEDLTGQGKKTVDALNDLIKKTSDRAGEVEVLVKRLKDLSTRLSTTAEFITLNIKTPLLTLLSLIIGFQYGLRQFMKSAQDGGSEEGGEAKGVRTSQKDDTEKGAGEDVEGKG